MTDWPNINWNQGLKLLGSKRIRDTSTGKPVLSKWYEVIQTDEFWDTGVEKLGLGLAKAWTGTGMKTLYEAGVKPPRFKEFEEVEPTTEEIEGEMRVFGERMWAVMQMSPREREAYVYTQNVENMRKQAMERRLFRGKREVVVRELEVAVANVEAAKWGGEEVDGVLAALLEKLKAEAQEQLTELLKLIRQKGLHKPELAQHKDFLIRLNRHLRKSTSDFKDDCENDKLTRLEIESRPMEYLIMACQTVLNSPEGSMPNPVEYLQESVAFATTSMEEALTKLEAELEAGEKMTQVLSAIKIIHTPTDVAASRAEITTLLVRARKAHLEGNAELCDEYATDILLNLDDSQLADNTSALASVVARAFLCRKLPVDDRLKEAERLVVALEKIKSGLEQEGDQGWLKEHWGYWYGVAEAMASVQLKRSRLGRVSVREHIERVWGDDMDLMMG